MNKLKWLINLKAITLDMLKTKNIFRLFQQATLKHIAVSMKRNMKQITRVNLFLNDNINNKLMIFIGLFILAQALL
jgi:hypothetical protein